jgi:predicted DsbA family dithiol-disulfide isomerase
VEQKVAAADTPPDDTASSASTYRRDMSDTSTGPLRIDIWSDVVCPWCYIGKRRFETALAAIGDDIEIEVTYRAYQLDPTASPGRTEAVRGVYERKFGGPEQADRIINHVSGIAAESGITFNMDQALRANTLLAHRLLWRAGQTSSPISQPALKERLLAAYFTEGRDIGDPDTLAELCAELGLDRDETLSFLNADAGRDEVAAEIAAASELGITAVPTYVIEGQWSIPGAQESDTFERVLRRLVERRAQNS